MGFAFGANEIIGGVVVNNSLQKLIEIEGVKPIYESCKNKDEANLVITCLWEGVGKKPDLKKKVQALYNDEIKGKRAPASTNSSKETNLTTKNLNLANNYENDPAVEALSKFYGDKLEEVLNPKKALTGLEKKDGTLLAIDHRQFIELYKSELGKTIINSFTSFCIDTNPKSCVPGKECEISEVKKIREDHREKNIDSLKEIDLSLSSDASKKWQNCIEFATVLCKKKDEEITGFETKKRSCLVMEYVSTIRKNIIAAEKQNKFYEDLNKTKSIEIVQKSKEITDPKKNSSDALLNISSSELKKSLKEPNLKSIQDFELCFKNEVIVNAKACEKYLSTNKEENDMSIAELGLRQMAQEERLKESLDGNEDKVKSYLKEEGYSDSQIQKMTSDKTNIDAIKTEILDRYKNQKKAIIEEMASRIEKRESAKQGKIDPQSTDDKSKLIAIRDEMSNRTKDLSGLVKFNNVVSAYLSVENKETSEKSRNVASLLNEVKGMEKEEAEKMKKAIKEATKNGDFKEAPTASSQVNLDVGQINGKFLNYSIQEEEKKDNKK